VSSKQLLRDSGTPQAGANATTENIGPLPDLANAYSFLTTGKLDLVFLVDLTGSFGDDIANFKAVSANVVNQIQASNPNARFGVATFQDYPFAPYVSIICVTLILSRLISASDPHFASCIRARPAWSLTNVSRIWILISVLHLM
jgi:hypothetical protein